MTAMEIEIRFGRFNKVYNIMTLELPEFWNSNVIKTVLSYTLLLDDEEVNGQRI